MTIVTKLMGGLGNQMFQYAYGRYLSLRNKCDLVLDTSFYLPGNQNSVVTREYSLSIFKNINCKIIDSSSLPFGRTLTLDGFFQRYDYVQEIRDILLHDFFIDIEAPHKHMLNKILDSNSVCIHVRRGDYVSFQQSANFHGFIGNEYFGPAIEDISKKNNSPEFFVFSDDIGWCQENIKTGYTTTFVTEEYNGHKDSSCFKLMSSCKHYIIPNSTFGWWAAFMSENSDKIVYAPKRWFLNNPEPDGLIPGHWIRL